MNPAGSGNGPVGARPPPFAESVGGDHVTLAASSCAEDELEIALFTTDAALARAAKSARIDSLVVDWEHADKRNRQAGHPTQIGCDTPEDARRLCAVAQLPVTVRIDNVPGRIDSQVELALDCGARRIMLPMAASVAEVERFLRTVDGRALTLVQIETQPLVDQCADLASLPWDCAYIGLNDLMISRGADWLWWPLLDGTVEHIFRTLEGRAVGFGGVTVLSGGSPIPFVHLLGEMARLGCRLSFLRQSFHREIPGRELAAEIAAVRACWRALRQRAAAAAERDRLRLVQLLSGLTPDAAAPPAGRDA